MGLRYPRMDDQKLVGLPGLACNQDFAVGRA